MPVHSRMLVPAAAEALAVLAARAAALKAASGGNLLECFAAVADPRDPRGVRHRLAAVLTLCTAAVLAGNTQIEDVTAWVVAAQQEVLAAAGCRRDAAGACVPPHPDTVVRVLTARGAQPLADHAGAFLAGRAHPGPVAFPAAGPGWLPAVAVDGKAVRGAAGPDGQIPYLLAAASHGTGTVLAENLIGPKTNEVPELAPLLRKLNEYYPLAGRVVTIDAGHTVKAHATFICAELLAHYVMTVKRSTPGLHDAPGALDWAVVPVQHVTEENGHGRRERRTIQVIDAPAHIRERFPRPAGRPHRALCHPHRPQAQETRQGLPQGPGQVSRRRAHHHQPGRPRGSTRAPGRLRARPLDDREQGPPGPRCHVP